MNKPPAIQAPTSQQAKFRVFIAQGNFTARGRLTDGSALDFKHSGLVTQLLSVCSRVVSAAGDYERKNEMLWTIFVILLVLWLLGMVSSYTLGGFIHILLVVAIAVLLINVISGRRAI
jgi:hypothetical protein